MPNLENIQSFFNGAMDSFNKAMGMMDEGSGAERIQKKAFFKIAEHHLKEAKKYNGLLGAEMNALIAEMRAEIKPPRGYVLPPLEEDAVCMKDGCRFWSKVDTTPFEAMTDHRNTTSQGRWGWEHQPQCPLHRLNVSYMTSEEPKNVPSSSHPLPSP